MAAWAHSDQAGNRADESSDRRAYPRKQKLRPREVFPASREITLPDGELATSRHRPDTPDYHRRYSSGTLTKLTKAKKNYSPYDRELLAVFASLKFFGHMLESLHFIIQRDHKQLNSKAVFKAQQEENVAEDHELASSSLLL